MTRNRMTSAILAGLVGFANSAGAVNLSTNGIGQVLIYPYYTVTAGQQTLLSVLNTTGVGKALKVRFHEAYNGRDVLAFNLFLSPYDIWTAVVFKLSDGGVEGDGAGIFTTDRSCMAPDFAAGQLDNGASYQSFRNAAYTGYYSDTGPIGDARTNEGYFEIITMADVTPNTDLDVDTTHVAGVPPRCAQAEEDFESTVAAVAPTTGLFGSASIVDVGQGTFLAYNADAVDGFTYAPLNSPPGDREPALNSANDRDNPLTATAKVFANGDYFASTFPGPQAIDAVSALFAAENLYNEYVIAEDGSIGTDWVMTFPTKHFYVDPLYAPENVIPPFEEIFGGVTNGMSCAIVGVTVFDREEDQIPADGGCGFPECPSGPPPSSLCLETNVFRFGTTSVLGSQLPTATITPLGQGMTHLVLRGNGHDMLPATNGNVFHGLPVTGFAVSKFVNDWVPLPGGGFGLANYTAAYHHRATGSCTNGTVPCS